MADDPNPPDPDAPDDPDDKPDLGDAGKRAIAAERAAAKAERQRADAAEAEVTRLKNDGASDIEQAKAQAKAEARAEVLESANERVVRAEIRAAAAGKLADPADAFAFITPNEFTVADDGTVDAKAITKAVDELVASKPYLAASTTPPPLAGGGNRGTAGKGSINDIIREAAGLG